MKQGHTTSRDSFTLRCLIPIILLCINVGSAQTRWEWRNPRPQGNTLNSIAYGDSILVAVGYGGAIVSSPDGGAWSLQPAATRAGLHSVIHAEGRFVIVGDSGTVLTSSDGSGWTRVNAGIGDNLYGLAYGNGIFVAISMNRILVSPDGDSWSDTIVESSTYLAAISFAHDRFLIAERDDTVLSSADGGSWSAIPGIPKWSSINSITWGGGHFVAAGDDGLLMTSPDCSTWTPRATPKFDQYTCVHAVGNRFLVFGNAGTILTSSSGEIWTAESSGTRSRLSAMAAGLGKLVAVGGYGKIITSTDTVSWSVVSADASGDNRFFRGVVWGNNRYVAVGDYGMILSSSDCRSWSDHSFPPESNEDILRLHTVVFGGGKFVAAGSNPLYAFSDVIATSKDGDTWTKTALPAPDVFSLAYGIGRYTAVGIGGVIIGSPDAETWAAETSHTTRLLMSVTCGNDRLIAVGDSGVILTRSQDSGWQPQASGTNMRLNAVTFGNGQYIAAGNRGTILSSADGETWTQKNTGIPTTESIRNASYGDGWFLLVGQRHVYFSPDGEMWQSASTDAPQGFNAVAYGDSLFIGVGDLGVIKTAQSASLPVVDRRYIRNPSFRDIRIRTVHDDVIIAGVSDLFGTKTVLTASLFTVSGKKIHSSSLTTGEKTAVLPVWNLQCGRYVVRLSDLRGNRIMTSFVKVQ